MRLVSLTMDSSFHNCPVYAPTQPPDKSQSTSSSSRTRFSAPYRTYSSSSHVTGQHTPHVSHNLPSISRAEHVSPNVNDSPTFRNMTSQPSIPSNHLFNGTQPGSYQYVHHGLPQANSPSSTYMQHQRSFTSSQPYNSQNSTAPQYHSYISSHSASGRLPDIRPMPAGGLSDPSRASHHKPSSSLTSLTLQTGQEAQPTHVVGSQGRRGILPSAFGRPAAVPTGSANGQKPANVPAKDAEGKFPCPHCAKTYLHAKHLKRHLLRREFLRSNYKCKLTSRRHRNSAVFVRIV